MLLLGYQNNKTYIFSQFSAGIVLIRIVADNLMMYNIGYSTGLKRTQVYNGRKLNCIKPHSVNQFLSLKPQPITNGIY